MRLIDADELLLNNTWLWYDENGNHTIAGDAIEDAPTVDAVPIEDYKSMEQTVNKLIKAIANAESVKHGHWIEIDRGLMWKCSECEHHSISGGHYCDWCGAKMDEVGE